MAIAPMHSPVIIFGIYSLICSLVPNSNTYGIIRSLCPEKTGAVQLLAHLKEENNIIIFCKQKCKSIYCCLGI